MFARHVVGFLFLLGTWSEHSGCPEDAHAHHRQGKTCCRGHSCPHWSLYSEGGNERQCVTAMGDYVTSFGRLISSAGTSITSFGSTMTAMGDALRGAAAPTIEPTKEASKKD